MTHNTTQQGFNYLQSVVSLQNQTLKNIIQADKDEAYQNQIAPNLHTSDFLYTPLKVSNFFEFKNKTIAYPTLIKQQLDKFTKHLDKLHSLEDIEKAEAGIFVHLTFGNLMSQNTFQYNHLTSTKEQLPLVYLPILLKLSFDTTDTEGMELPALKRKVLQNGLNLYLMLKDFPFIPQEYYKHEEDYVAKDYFPLFDKEIFEALLVQLKEQFVSVDEKSGDLAEDTIVPTEKIDKENITANDKLTYHLLKPNEQQSFRSVLNSLEQLIENSLANTDIAERYTLDFERSYILFAKEDVDVLYRSYRLIEKQVSQAIKRHHSLANNFFNPIGYPIDKSREEQVFFDSSKHYGSFALNFLPNNDTQNLAINQRIAVNCTQKSEFYDGEVLVVNGPPGTGKTTVLQSMIANLVVDNTLAFLSPHTEDTRYVQWAPNFLTPRNLIIGASFTNQAVRNISESLDFKPPIYKDKEVKLGWNKRWLKAPVKNKELPYSLNLAKDEVSKIRQMDILAAAMFNLDYLKESKAYFVECYGEYKSATEFGFQQLEDKLVAEIFEVKEQLDRFQLGYLTKYFCMNEESHYTAKTRWNKAQLDQEMQAIEEETVFLQNFKLLFKEEKSLQTQIEKLNLEKEALQSKVAETDLLITNIAASLISKLKVMVFGQDKALQVYKAERQTVLLAAKKIDTQIQEKEEELSIMGARLLNSPYRSTQAVDKRLAELAKEKNKIAATLEESRQFFHNLQTQLSQFSPEFYYAQDALSELKAQIEDYTAGSANNLYAIYERLNGVLDSTYRYKLFHLVMRYKEWLFLQLTEKIVNKDNTARFMFDELKFKNAQEIWELQYWSLLFPLFISTLHSLTNHTTTVASKIKISEPGQVDTLIIDEAGQISADLAYIGFWTAKKIICVGDTDQIAPVFPIEKELDYLFAKNSRYLSRQISQDEYGSNVDKTGGVNCFLASFMSIAQKLSRYHQYSHKSLSRGLYLVEHRRCPDEIIDFCNEIVYKGILVPKKGSFVAALQSESDFLKENFKAPWIFKPVIPSTVAEKNQNAVEAAAIFAFIKATIERSNGVYTWENIGEQFAILTPHRPQANFLLEYFFNHIDKELKGTGLSYKKERDKLLIGKGVLIMGTVHALQGAEKKVILFSLVKRASEIGAHSVIIQNKAILNVGVSRAKLSIVLFGDQEILKKTQFKEIEFLRKQVNIFRENKHE